MAGRGVSLEFWATLEVIGPREVGVRRIASIEYRCEDLVLVFRLVVGRVGLEPTTGGL